MIRFQSTRVGLAREMRLGNELLRAELDEKCLEIGELEDQCTHLRAEVVAWREKAQNLHVEMERLRAELDELRSRGEVIE